MPTSREKLVAAMSTSLRRRGFGATSMKELLTEAGVSSGSMYHAFPGGKEALAAAAVRDVGRAAAEQIRAVLAAAPTTAEGVRRIFDHLADDLQAHDYRLGCPIGVPATEAAGVSDALRGACVEVFEAWATAYAHSLAGEGWSDDAAHQMGVAIVTAYEGSVSLARTLQRVDPVHTTRDALQMQLARRPHGAAPPAP